MSDIMKSIEVVSAEEMTRLRRNTEMAAPKDDVLEWLLLRRDDQASIVQAEFQRGDLADYGVINPAQELSSMFGASADEVKFLRGICSRMTEALRGRVLVALAEAKAPPWTPTHQHYKGKAYRFLRLVQSADHEELEDMVMYDDSEGNTFVLSKNRWESHTGTGRPRYQYIGVALGEM